MNVRKIQINQLFNQRQDPLASAWPPWEIGAFIDSVNDDINRALPRQFQHVRHTFFERTNTRLPSAATVVRIYPGEDIITRIRFDGKLGNEGGEKTMAVLLLDISEIKVIVRHRGQSRCTHALDVLNDCRSSSH